MQAATLNPLRRILIPLDGSAFAEQALPFARAVGGEGAELLLLRVVPRGEAIYGLLGDQLVSDSEVQQAEEIAARKNLEQVREERLGNSPKASVEVASGDYADGILDTAERSQVDLIVMATHGRGGLDRWIIGSVADRVARTSTIPVMLIQPRGDKSPEAGLNAIERLIVPLDGSALAAQALPFAGRIAAQINVPVLLVSVTDLPRQLSATAGYGAAFSQQVYDELIAAGRAEATQTLAQSVSQLQVMGVVAGQQLLEGPVAKAIAGAASENDLIVMTSHGHGGIRRLFLGSVANQLVNQGRVAVVLVPAVDKNEQSSIKSGA